MIYNSMITSIQEEDVMSLLEEVELKYEHETIAETGARVVAEHEANWTKFMTAVGLSELNSICEGEIAIYEGARLESLVKKAKGIFELAINKLAEITKRFMARVDGIIKGNDAFVKKYGVKLKNMKFDAKEVNLGKVYIFEDSHLDKGFNYRNSATAMATISDSDIQSILSDKDKYSSEKAENDIFGGSTPAGDSLNAKLKNYFYKEGDGSKVHIDLGEQVKILERTKGLKKDASDAFKKAKKEIKDIISALTKAEKAAAKGDNVNPSLGDAYSVILGYWKTYSRAIMQGHTFYLATLNKRQAQAKSLCVRALNAKTKETSAAKSKEIKAKMESFADTDAFLGAVEFI